MTQFLGITKTCLSQWVHDNASVLWLTLEGKFLTQFSCSCSPRRCSRGKRPTRAAPACATALRRQSAGERGPRACVSEWGSFQIRPRLEQSASGERHCRLWSRSNCSWRQISLTLTFHIHAPAWRSQPAVLFSGCGCSSWFRRTARRWEARFCSGCLSTLIGWLRPSSGKSETGSCPGTTFLHWHLKRSAKTRTWI